MKKTLVLLCIALAFVANTQGNSGDDDEEFRLTTPPEHLLDFEGFKSKYGRSYPDTQTETLRRGNFQKYLKKVKENNADPNRKHTIGITQFSDLTEEEFKALYLGARPVVPPSENNPGAKRNLQKGKGGSGGGGGGGGSTYASLDWVAQGKVTGVRNQRQCGSCWSFSAIAAIESLYLLSGQTLDLSEQQSVDCAYNGTRNGCDGGWMGVTFDYARDVGVTDEVTYPYVGYYQACAVTGGAYKISGHTYLYKAGCSAVHAALVNQPLSVTVDATDWKYIIDQIFPYRASTWKDLNHAVLATGFVKAKKMQNSYWIIKNSWGTNWGQSGYAKLQFGPDGNSYGICEAVPYPHQ